MSASKRAAASPSRRGRRQWFLTDLNRLGHEIQLLCLPHAGGAASSYRDWLAPASTYVDVVPVQLPGHENRIGEPYATDMTRLVADLVAATREASLRRIALFGHSLGAIIALYVCRLLEETGLDVVHLFVSGHPGPRLDESSPRPPVMDPDSSEDALVRAVSSLGNSVLSSIADLELRRSFLSMLRADLRLVASVNGFNTIRVNVPITALGGESDPVLCGCDLSAWRRVTNKECAIYRLPGSHFYLSQDIPGFAELIRDRLLTSGRELERDRHAKADDGDHL